MVIEEVKEVSKGRYFDKIKKLVFEEYDVCKIGNGDGC